MTIRYKRLKPLKRHVFNPLDPARALPANLAWYVLTVEAHREYQVARWLEGVKTDEKNSLIEKAVYPTLVPLETRWRLMDKRRGGGKPPRVRYQVPLIPRVVIVGCAGEFRFEAMDNYFVTGVLGIGGVPCPMRAGEAERLQAGSERLRRSVEPKPLAVGGKAMLTAPGLFMGHIVDVATLTGKWAKIVQNWFGSSQEVTVNQADLEAVETPPIDVPRKLAHTGGIAYGR